jgi:hypothetical protein
MKLKSFAASVIFSIAAFASVKAQNVDEVVSKYIAAKGGADKLKSVNTIVEKGTLNANGQKIPINMTIVNGKAMKQDYTVNGMTGYQIVTATEGWNYNPFMGQTKSEAMTADDVKSSQDQLDATDDLFDYVAKGTTVEYLGKDDVEGTECYKLKLTMKSGKEKTCYISTEDNLLVKITEKVTANGQEQEVNTMLSNYKEVNGIQFPFAVTGPFGLVEMDTIEINTDVDESVFKPTN